MGYEIIKHKSQFHHQLIAAVVFATTACLAMEAFRMSLGESDIVDAYKESLAAATKIDSFMGITEAQANIDAHAANQAGYAWLGMGLAATSVVAPFFLLRTRKEERWTGY